MSKEILEQLNRFNDSAAHGLATHKLNGMFKRGSIAVKPTAQGMIKAAVEIIRILYRLAGFKSPEGAFKALHTDKWIHEYPE